MYDITGEGNVFDDLGLYYMYDSDKLQYRIRVVFTFWLFITSSGVFGEDRLATLFCRM